MGGLQGSPVFGPGFSKFFLVFILLIILFSLFKKVGPFNNPIAREERIDELVNLNRRINGRGPVNNPVPFLQYGYGYPMYY